MIKPTGGVVVARGISGGHVERHVQATGDFVEDFLLEFGVAGRRLLRVHLGHLPAARHGEQGPFLQFDWFEWFGRIGLAASGSVGVQDAGEVGGRFGGGKHGERESTQLCEQRQRRRDIGNATRLPRSIAAEVVNNARGRIRGRTRGR